MPEGDTIWRAARDLHGRLAGRSVTGARPAALQRLSGRRLQLVEPRGKHLYMHFDGGLILHTHMRMTGAWHVYAPGERWRRAPHRATAVIEFDGEQAVLFAAPVCELQAEGEQAALGPDVLAGEFDLDEVLRRSRACLRPTVAEVLLDQRVCAGVGNIYRCDALWYELIDPLLPVARLDDATLVSIYRRVRDLMHRNAVGDAFRVGPAVHGRSGRPCRRCGTAIASGPLGAASRILFWCPRCQAPGSAGLRPPG